MFKVNIVLKTIFDACCRNFLGWARIILPAGSIARYILFYRLHNIYHLPRPQVIIGGGKMKKGGKR